MNSQPPFKAHFIEANRLAMIVRQSVEEIEAEDELADGCNEALGVFLLAASALECLANELQTNLDFISSQSGESLAGPIKIVSNALRCMEDGKCSSRSKCEFLLSNSLGDEFRLDHPLLHDLNTLFHLRNLISHKKPEVIKQDREAIVRKLQSRQLCNPAPNRRGPWLSEVATKKAAQWASETVHKTFESVNNWVVAEAIKIHPGLGAFSRFYNQSPD